MGKCILKARLKKGHYGFSGGVVFFDSSVLVTVPSADLVTVFSLDLTEPSLLISVDFSLETCRSHPISGIVNATAKVATQ